MHIIVFQISKANMRYFYAKRIPYWNTLDRLETTIINRKRTLVGSTIVNGLVSSEQSSDYHTIT